MTQPSRSPKNSRSRLTLAVPVKAPWLHLAVRTKAGKLEAQEYRHHLKWRLARTLEVEDPKLEEAQELLDFQADLLDQEPLEAPQSHLILASALLGNPVVDSLLLALLGNPEDQVQLQPLEGKAARKAEKLAAGEVVLALSEAGQALAHRL